MTHFFKLFANCIPVKGANRSIIFDLQRGGNIKFIPNDLFEILLEFNKKKSINKVIDLYGKENKTTINDYVKHLLNNELGFLCDEDEFDLFPEMDLNFYKPNKITNIILELEKIDSKKLNILRTQLEILNCEALNIVTYFSLSFEDFKLIHSIFNGSKLKSIEIITNFHESLNDTLFQKLRLLMNKFTKLIIYNSKENKTIEYKKFLLPIRFTTKNIQSFKTCGNISTDYFSIHKNKFLESLQYNSCLNRKISIDIAGNIKNCPAMLESFGNIKETTLEEALNHKNFKKYWNISKDQIDVCKDCEFRHVCTDCRAFIENPKDKFSKPLKCGYSPYTNKWEEWSTNPLKQKAIEYYGMQELVKKNDA